MQGGRVYDRVDARHAVFDEAGIGDGAHPVGEFGSLDIDTYGFIAACAQFYLQCLAEVPGTTAYQYFHVKRPMPAW